MKLNSNQQLTIYETVNNGESLPLRICHNLRKAYDEADPNPPWFATLDLLVATGLSRSAFWWASRIDRSDWALFTHPWCAFDTGLMWGISNATCRRIVDYPQSPGRYVREPL